MVIIIIIVGGSLGLAAAFWPIAFVLALIFSGSGDGVPGTINEIQRDTLCYPSPQIFLTLRALGEDMDSRGIKYNEDRVEKIIKEYGVIRVKEGMDAKILKNGTFLRLDHSSAVTMTPIQLIDSSQNSCYVNNNFLAMTLYQWIKWKIF